MSKLYFRPGDMEGFTSKRLADNKQGYAIPIRELVQNSLDASRNQNCKVDIYLETIKKKDIPHIGDYENVLKQAIQTQTKSNSYNANSKNVVDSINKYLEEDSVKILLFVDNGKGMPKETLNGLLDERSIKSDESSSGSFGVGHLSSYFLSSLNYVMYATKYKGDNNKKEKTLWTGSPILAGHSDGSVQRGAKGRIVEELPDELNPDFIFPEIFPDFIKSKMDKLESTGSMVAILGLNEAWGEDAEYVIVSNFFYAMAHTGLTINIHNKQSKNIDDKKLKELIELRKNKTRRTGDDILSGQMVYQAYQAVVEKNLMKIIDLSNGDKVNVYIDNNIESSNSGIVLIRNGMLVARHDCMLSKDIKNLQDNKDFKPFMAVIDVDANDSPELFELVKGAENPYHNKLKSKTLLKNKEKKLKELFKELTEGIKEHLEKINRGGFCLSLFDMPIKGNIKGDDNIDTLPKKPDKAKSKPVKRLIPPKSPKICPDCGQAPCICPCPNCGQSPCVCPKPEPRPKPDINLRQLESRNATRYIDKGKALEVRMRIKPTKQPDGKDNVYFSIALAEDNDNNEASEFAEFNSLFINNNEVSKDKFMVGKRQIDMGKLNESDTYNIVAMIVKPGGFDNTKIALRPIFGLKQNKKQQK